MRTKKALKNIVTSMMYQIVSIICGLIAPRLILTAFGSTYNGVVSSATQLLSVISVLTLGIAGATRVALYKTLSQNDILGTSRIIKSNKRYMRKVAIALIVYAIALMAIYPFISHNDLSRSEVALLIGIVSLSSIAEYFFGVSNVTLLSADQSGYISNIVNIVARIVNTVFIFIFVKSGMTVFTVYLVSSLVFFVSPAVLNYIVKIKYNLIVDCEPDDSALKQRGAVAFHSIANLIHNNTDLVLLTIFTDAKIISVYTVYYLVVGKIKSIMSVFTNGMEGAFGDMWARKEYENFKRNFRTYEYALYTFAAIIFSCVGVLILPFLEIYTYGVNDVNYIRISLAVLITITEALYCVRHPYLTIVQATGNYEATKMGALMEAVVNISISIILVNIIGINGVIIGTLIANLIRTSQFAAFSCKYIIKDSIKSVLLRFIWLVGDSSIIVAVSLIVLKTIQFPTSWLGWVVEAGIVFVIACCVTLVASMLFYKRDLQHLLDIINRMLHLNRKVKEGV